MPITLDVARHLYTRQLDGIVIVLAEKPEGMLSATTKQWYKIVRHTEHERASTLTATRIMELTQALVVMQRMRFTAAIPGDPQTADVFFATLDQLDRIPQWCHTLYVTYEIEKQLLQRYVIDEMPLNSLVVTYANYQKV